MIDYRVFSHTHPAGVVPGPVGLRLLNDEIRQRVTKGGSARVPCLCCGRRIVVKQDGTALNQADLDYLSTERGYTIPGDDGPLTAAPQAAAQSTTSDVLDFPPGGPFGG